MKGLYQKIIAENLEEKYFYAFYFYMAKPINEILVDYPSSTTIRIKDLKIFDEEQEYLMNYINSEKLKEPLNRLVSNYSSQRYQIYSKEPEIQKILSKYEKKKHEQLYFDFQKYSQESFVYETHNNLGYEQNFITGNLNHSTNDISYSWTIHDIYSPNLSVDNRKDDGVTHKRDSPVYRYKKGEGAKKIINSINDKKKKLITPGSQRFSPNLNKSKKKFDNSNNTLEKSSIAKEKKYQKQEESKKETANIKKVKITGRSIEIPKLIMTTRNKKSVEDLERTIKTERDKEKSGTSSLLDFSVNSKKEKPLSKKMSPPKTNKDSINPTVQKKTLISRPTSSIKEEHYFTRPINTKKKKTFSAKPNPKIAGKSLTLRNDGSKKGKSIIDEERLRKIISMTQEGKVLFTEINAKKSMVSKKEPLSTTRKKVTTKNGSQRVVQTIGNGFWTSRNPEEFGKDFNLH